VSGILPIEVLKENTDKLCSEKIPGLGPLIEKLMDAIFGTSLCVNIQIFRWRTHVFLSCIVFVFTTLEVCVIG